MGCYYYLYFIAYCSLNQGNSGQSHITPVLLDHLMPWLLFKLCHIWHQIGTGFGWLGWVWVSCVYGHWRHGVRPLSRYGATHFTCAWINVLENHLNWHPTSFAVRESRMPFILSINVEMLPRPIARPVEPLIKVNVRITGPQIGLRFK